MVADMNLFNLFLFALTGPVLSAGPLLYDHSQLGLPTKRPLNIAHRGSSGTLPEHTAAAYGQAVEDGADVLECDVIITKDLKLACRHEHQLHETTNVAEMPQFAAKKKTYTYNGHAVTDWFAFDFTLEELRMLKAKQRYDFRDLSYNDKYTIATFDEFVAAAKNADRPVGIFPEIKQPAMVNAVPGLFKPGVRFEDIVMQELSRHGYQKAEDGCLIQCFANESLVYIKNKYRTQIPLVICVYEHVTDVTIASWAAYNFQGVCFWKDQMYASYKNGTYKNYYFDTTDFAERCRNMGLDVYIYTMRNEDRFLAWDLKQDIFNEFELFSKHVIKGYFVDSPATFKRYLDYSYAGDECLVRSAAAQVSVTMQLLAAAVVAMLMVVYWYF